MANLTSDKTTRTAPNELDTKDSAPPLLSEDKWLSLAKRLQAIASTGLFFGEGEFDKERYHEVHDIAKQMLAELGQGSLKTIDHLLINQGKSYETPKVDVRGAVFCEDKILLVQEKLDGLWTLPGGYADVGISPAENVVKEIFEEANLDVTATKLIAIIHKARHPYDMDIRDFYKLFFLCDLANSEHNNPTPEAGSETLDAGFFELDKLPPLSTGRVIETHIQLANEYRLNPEKPTLFD